MRRLAVCGVALVVCVMFVLAFGAHRASAAQETVYFCHRSASETNPYNMHSGSPDSIIQAGHGEHTGPVFPDMEPPGNGVWGDIIPPFDYTGGHFPGLNWNAEGMDVLSAGCLVIDTPIPPEETTTTTLPSTTTTLPSTTTTVPPTTTTVPSTTTSSPTTSTSQPSTIPPTTPTTSPTTPPPVTDPAGGVETLPPTEAVVVDPGDQTHVLGPLSPTEEAEVENELDAAAGQPLAETGAGLVLGVLGAGGFLLVCIGSALFAHSRRKMSFRAPFIEHR
jgi:hypothetical protein